MLHFEKFIVFLSLILGIASNQELKFTTDKQFLLKQAFVYQLLWDSEELEVYHKKILEKASSFQIEDLKNLSANRNASQEFTERLGSGAQLPRGSSCTAFYPAHLSEIVNFVDVLLGARSFEDFAVLAVWSKRVLNQILWLFGVAIAVLRRPDTRHVRLPNLSEIMPQYFYEDTRVMDAFHDKRDALCGGHRYYVNAATKNKSQTSLNLESVIDYFTKDLDLSTYYFYLNLDLPFWMNSKKYQLPNLRRGERYFNDHKQLLARYNLERLSWNLPEIEDIDWDRKIVTGFYPDMSDYNRVPFPNRPNNASVPVHKYNLVQLAKNYEDRLTSAADGDILLTENGTNYNGVNDKSGKFLNDLMNTVQGNGDSVNQQFYGSLDATARRILGFSPEPANKANVTISAMENLNADLMDPAFYRLYKKIVNIGLRYKSHLPPYTKEEINFPGVRIDSVYMDKVVTFFDKTTSVLGHNECSNMKQKPFFVEQQRLNHNDFRIRMFINSDKSRKAVLRIFLGPKRNSRNKTLDFEEARHHYFQLDQFVVDLQQGQNEIIRHDEDFAFQVEDDPRSDVFYAHLKRALDGNSSLGLGYCEQPYGFPRRLLVPRGNAQGLSLRLFVIASPVVSDNIVDGTIIAGRQLDDGRPLGFPLDRPIQTFRFDLENFFFRHVKIYHV